MKMIRVGESYVVVHPRLAGAIRGTVAVLTQEPGRHVGIRFPNPIPEGHDLDGRVPTGTGYWVHPSHLLTGQEFEALQAAKRAASEYPEVKELSFDPDTGTVG